MVTKYAVKEIKQDLDEIVRIAIEDRVSNVQIHNAFVQIKSGLINHWSQEKLLEKVNEYADRELAASEIIGQNIILERFVEKIRSIIYKYHSRQHDLGLLLVQRYFITGPYYLFEMKKTKIKRKGTVRLS